MKTKYLKPVLFLLLTACGNRGGHYEFWDISKFNLDPEAFENQEEIKLIYTSRGPDPNNDRTYYIHVIAVSQRTGDTINILTTADNGFAEKDRDKTFNFFNQESLLSKVSQMAPDQIKDLKHVDEIKSTEPKTIDKVARDPKFDHIADNQYPTVIGIIGTFIPSEE